MKRIVTVFLLALLPLAASATDRPGQKFLLKPSDLPYAAPVANDGSLPVADDVGQGKVSYTGKK